MKFKRGNKLWEHRSEHGRDTLFASPMLLWNAACEYFEWCDENPLLQHDFVGKDAEEVNRKKMRPYTIWGLTQHLNCNSAYLLDFKKSHAYKDNPDFSSVISAIEDTIRRQKFEGAAAGFFNANIISRDLGMIDKQEVKQTVITVEQPEEEEEEVDETVD